MERGRMMGNRYGFAERIGGSDFGKKKEVFKFEKIKQAKRQAKKENPNKLLIDMGVGEPDYPADAFVRQVLKEEVDKAANRFYADNGIMEYRIAAASYMEEVYGVSGLDPETEICHGIGSKSILAMLPFAFIEPGDITLLTVPGYPILGTSTIYLGGEVFELPLVIENEFLPDLDMIPVEICKRSKLLYLNYPNNPTGAVAPYEFYEKVVAFASKYNIIVVNDAAYGAIVYGGRKPFSFLSVPGAKEIGVEIQSMSKAFCMTGWRLGFVAGNREIVQGFEMIKDNMDSGQFRAIQLAAAYALKHPELTRIQVERYERRMKALVETLNEIGFDARVPAGTYYCYVKTPTSAKVKNGSRIYFEDAEEVATFLIEEAMVSVVPWTEAGDYLRFSVTYDAGEDTDYECMEELKRRLHKLQLKF